MPFQPRTWVDYEDDLDEEAMNDLEARIGGFFDDLRLAAINVKTNFGATGDGVTDDTAEIQAAFDSLTSAGGAVYFPVGSYKVSSPITLPRPSNGRLIIEGLGAKIITDDAISMFQATMDPSEATDGTSFVSSCLNWTIRGFDFVGDGTADQKGVEIHCAYNLQIEDCYFQSLDIGIDVRFGLMTTTRGNLYFGCRTAGCVLGGGQAATHLEGAVSLPEATIDVPSTAQFKQSGEILVGAETVTYTGKTPTSFTGCSGGTGTAADGVAIKQGLWDGASLNSRSNASTCERSRFFSYTGSAAALEIQASTPHVLDAVFEGGNPRYNILVDGSTSTNNWDVLVTNPHLENTPTGAHIKIAHHQGHMRLGDLWASHANATLVDCAYVTGAVHIFVSAPYLATGTKFKGASAGGHQWQLWIGLTNTLFHPDHKDPSYWVDGVVPPFVFDHASGLLDTAIRGDIYNPVTGDPVLLSTTGVTTVFADTYRVKDAAGAVTRLAITPTQMGFNGAGPIAVPAAYTQTYSTAHRTLGAYTADVESSAYTGAADSEAKLADLNALRVAYENLRAFTEDLAKQHNAVLDDLQAYGLLQ